MKRYRNPAELQRPSEPVPYSPIDPTKPRMAYPPAIYERLMTMPDDEFTVRMSMTEPPVP